ncbi:MAG: hypothetical protein E7261_05915 [Lachnospiraceae bacterium]|nr:hypothetical protein [Lachnospiraceae bacterium]
MAKSNICPYCGASLLKNATHCEHCLHEIESVAKQRHEDTIKGLRKDRRAMKKTLPKKIVALFSHKIAIVITALVVIVLVGVLVAFISAKLHNTSEDNTEEKWLKTLEEYYANEQYKELTEYVDENYIYGYKFDKYTQVADAYYYYMKIAEMWDYYCNEMGPEADKDSRIGIMYWVLYYGIRGMHAAEDGYTDKGLLGNETLLKEIYADIKIFMLDKFPVTEEKISEMLALESLEEEDLYPYSDAVVTELGCR